ncbi:uncharacterized protein [Acropora muricata]|uniref:uncharacterized protein n=1 Tax=Acropora muricata TaxID=159855 RepID=UPI0034E537C6
MPGKLAKNKKIREGQRAHAVKVLSSVNEVLSEYDGSRGAKDNINQLNIALNEKLVTLKALDESILYVKGIRAALDSVEIQVRGLQSLGIDSGQYGALLIPIFMEKLPDELKLIVSRRNKDDWELNSVLGAVKSEVEARERSGIQPTIEETPPRRLTFHTGSNNATASALFSGEGKFSCLLCRGNHRASEYHVVTNIKVRKGILKKQGRYFICLRRAGHLARNCNSKIQCLGCQGRHHLAVWDGRGARASDNSDSAVDGVSNQPESATSAMHVSSGMHVFLQTAQVVLSKPGLEGTKKLNVRATFHTGAQRSYVSQRVVDALKLETINTEKLGINTFGNQRQQVQAVHLVELALSKPETGFKLTLNAFSVPHICSELHGQDLNWVKENYPHLREIEFADSLSDNGPMKIDLLIGSDYIWNFFNGSTIRGEESVECGPVAVSTTVGWVLSGPVKNLPKEKLSSIQFSSTHVLRVDSRSNDTLYEDFEKLWDLDSIGIREKDTVLEAFEKNVIFQDGRYSVHLPWKEHHKLLPDNYENSVARLSSQLKQLRRDPEVLREYNSIIEDQLRSGIIEFEAILKLAESLEPTRRSLLKVTSSFFDPLGILSPVLVQMKLLFQLLCQENVAWDAPLPEPVRRQWKAWLQDLREVQQIMIPRCLYDGVEGVATSYTLHGFGDASEKAYCAVVYVVLETSSGNYPVLLTSKTRVAPLTKQYIPRLELLSGVILARLASSVKEALQSQIQIDKTYLWLDSKTTIYWIKGSKEWKQFVQNRVTEILTLTEESMWNHCPGTENPADIG